jgi:hypothetical protein
MGGDTFQFQFGTIDSGAEVTVSHGIALFQFQFGTIDSFQQSKHYRLFMRVSIPVWYD